MVENWEDRIYALVAKEAAGELTREEAVELDSLLSEHPEFGPVREHLLVEIFQFEEPAFNSDSALDKLHGKILEDIRPKRVFFRPQVYRWAAVILLFAAAILYFNRNNSTHAEWVEVVASNGDSSINLPDGSRVVLSDGSEIRYQAEFDDSIRNVKLVGKAYFKVTRNPSKPFVVRTESSMVRVLGTSFVVSDIGREVEVLVETGKVRVAPLAGKSKVELTKGQGAILNKASGVFKRIDVDMNDLFWISKRLEFMRSPLQNVVEQINKKYKKKIILKSDDIKKCELTVAFTNQSAEDVANVIAMTLGLDTIMQKDTIYLDGPGCQ